jgi:2-phospho-L-lactate guanylyltransferase
VSITAIIPLKPLDDAKRRLAGSYTGAQRRTLMTRLFTRVAQVCTATPGIDAVRAVVGDDEGAGLARRVGVEAVREPAGGLNRAIAHATADLRAAASLVVVADLPGLTVVDLTRVVEAGTHRPGVVVAATRDGGTGALLRRPTGVIAPAYGPGSAAAHLAAAVDAGVRAVLLSSPGLAHDVDRPDDVARYAGGVDGSGPR